MDVMELYGILAKLIAEGKGKYLVDIRFEEEQYEDRAYGVDIEDEHEEIVIKAV